MKKSIIYFVMIVLGFKVSAQVTGDTLRVKAFKYGSATRDTFISFPPSNLTYEKVILKYNMRCKNNLISTQAAPNQGCGEWDYSCNTYLVDSNRIENDLNLQASHVISNFTGTVFPYTTQPIYDYYNFSQTTVSLSSIVSENQYTLGLGTGTIGTLLKTNERSGKTQLLYTAAELSTAGFVAGNINGLLLSVANAGGSVNFFKVGLQHTTAGSLNSATATLSGFTNVYNANKTFTVGSNRIQFHTPFVWNGTDNVLIELSFTNTNPGNAIVLIGTTSASVLALYANNNYALDLSALGHVNLNTSMMGSISNEITVSFWVYGNASMLPANTSLIYGYGSTSNERNLNLHLPWSDGSMYFDCGYSAGGYDRINKTALASEQGGQWNHWAVTKNAVTGNMNIYLNGALWFTGTGKTKPISILTLILGKDKDFLNNYKGKINELCIWNKELGLSDIQGWMNKPMNATHPFYSNLLAYYRMNEGTGLSVTDSKNNLVSNGVNLQWTYDRGNNLNRSFFESNLRPNLVFLKGTYAMSTNTVMVKDSIVRNPNVVQQYSITSTATVAPMTNDVVNLVSTTSLYQSRPINIYNGDTGVLTGTLATPSQGTINISNLNYFKRYPYYNEIMSFVTPYGKGLDLGSTGKTWYYVVTDFTPILKGKKRLVMTLGGENQEQMDLDFIFIVGTPPRDVIEFKQLWQGAARAGGAGINSIVNDTRFPVLNNAMLSNGQSFKIRSTITGHGAQGEFRQNGGTINHYFNVNGGANEFNWNLTIGCSTNPIFPQGGTWIYDREGWCPGKSSLLKEMDITPFVSPGTSASLDYSCSNPPNPTGDYRYLVANQLITYGGANRSVDAAILDVLAPSTKVLYSRTNPICANPLLLIQNTGSSTITSMEIEYAVNNAAAKETYTWTGSLAFMDTITIALPIGNLWMNSTLPTGNVFKAEIKKVNGANDQYVYNNKYSSAFQAPISIANDFMIEFRTNNNPYENSYTLYDDQGNVAGLNSFTIANNTYQDSYQLFGCYKLVVEDIGHDGVQWWANTAQGAGYVKLKDAAGGTIKTFQADFGSRFEFSFSTYNPLGIGKNDLEAHITMYPNPAHEKFFLQGAPLDGAVLKMSDVLGREVTVPISREQDKCEINTSSLKPGMYVLTITKNNQQAVKKVVVN